MISISFFISLFVLLLLFSNANSEIIEDVVLKGNKRISLPTVIVLGDIKIGDKYNDEALNEIVKKLYGSGFFNNIEIELKKNSLFISVNENPIIENIEITGIKSENLNEILIENIKTKRNMSYSDNQLKYDIISINNT